MDNDQDYQAGQLAQPQQELAAIIERYCKEDGLFETPVPGLAFYRASSTSIPTCGIYKSVLVLIPQGEKNIMLGDEAYRYGPDRYLVTSVDMPVVAQVTQASPEKPILSFVLALDSSRIADLMADAALPRPPLASVARGLAVGNLSVSMLDPALRLARLVESPEDAAILAPLLERELLYRLLTSEQGQRLRSVAMADSQSQRISRAIAWLKSRFDQPLSIDDLANAAGMSKSSLHQHFKALTAMSPLQYQKQLRLHEARRLMLTEAHDAASAGHRVGYESASQFSREYRRMFGAPPLKDMARLRQSAA